VDIKLRGIERSHRVLGECSSRSNLIFRLLSALLVRGVEGEDSEGVVTGHADTTRVGVVELD